MGAYAWNTIFTYNSTTDVIIPLFNIIINNTRFNIGTPITRYTSFGGLNLFNYIGKGITGTWDPTRRELVISGFY